MCSFSRSKVSDYMRLKEIDETIGRVNGKFANALIGHQFGIIIVLLVLMI